MRFLVYGSAGFIGFHLIRRLLEAGHTVVGVDGMTTYYDVTLKEARHALLSRTNAFQKHIAMLEDYATQIRIAEDAQPDVIIHLAAQAGVRYSLENPRAYIDSNLVGTFNVLEIARSLKPKHFLLASTSSVYGANKLMPFREIERTDHPLTLYAATKKATEDMAHSYSHLWAIPTTVFRFFTVYGPWGRPDMALFKFVKATLAGEAIDVYGYGQMLRDFTYVGDLVDSIVNLVECVPVLDQPVGPEDSLSPAAPYRVVNIGGGTPVNLMDYIDIVEKCLGMPAKCNMMEMQKGDVPATFASPDLLLRLTGRKPGTPIETGVRAFVDWYREYYKV
jgi:UDP-glucuronate 4-epimerase